MPIVHFNTTMGSFALELYDQHAPRTVANFLELCRTGYYNGTTFHRVIPGFIIQGGDPSGTGLGGTSIYDDYNDGRHLFRDEETALKTLKHTGAGILAMANSGPNTNGSQFYITLAPAKSQDGKSVVFGRVAQGMAIIERIGKVEIDANSKPRTAIVVNEVDVEEDDNYDEI